MYVELKDSLNKGIKKLRDGLKEFSVGCQDSYATNNGFTRELRDDKNSRGPFGGQSE